MNDTKKRIFETSILLFSQTGYDNTSMDQIAKVSNVAKGTLYYHFKNKEAIFNYIIEEGVTLIYENAHVNAVDLDDPLEKIKSICTFQMKIALEKKDLFKMLISEIWGKQIRQHDVRMKIKHYIKEMAKLIENAQSLNEIKKEDPTLMAFNIFGALISTCIYEIMTDTSIKNDDVIDKSIEFILNGIRF